MPQLLFSRQRLQGPFLHPNNTRIAAKRCHYNTGNMTLAELGMAFWHDLAASSAGILASMIVNWLEQAEVTCHAGVRLPMAICARTQAAGVKLCGLFRRKMQRTASG